MQDDWRVARSLLVSAGVRYGWRDARGGRVEPVAARQRRLVAVQERAASPCAANYGYFYDWIAGDIYKQTLLVDGYRQREFNISNPSYPNPGLVGTSPPTNQYLWSDGLVLPSAQRAQRRRRPGGDAEQPDQRQLQLRVGQPACCVRAT